MHFKRMGRWLSVVSIAILSGCASQHALVPQIQQTTQQDGLKTVSVASEPVLCSRPQCPHLSAHWNSAKTGQAVLQIGLPYQNATVTGADFYFGGGEVLRVRSRSQAQPEKPQFPTTAFDVPLRTVERIAYTPRSWMRVYTNDGSSIDETIHSGEEASRAFSGMHYFIGAVQASGGQGTNAGNNPGGLMDRLGLGDEKKR